MSLAAWVVGLAFGLSIPTIMICWETGRRKRRDTPTP